MLLSSRTILIVTLFTCFQLSAQTSGPLALVTEKIDFVEPVAEDRFMPALPSEGILPFIHRKLVYPEIAVENGVEGTVVIEIAVSSSGQITKARAMRSIPLLDEAALAAISELPTLLPAVEDGWPVARRLFIPIRFRLR